MGVIRKKTASRGTEAGTKFHCDVCSIDVTSTVSVANMITMQVTLSNAFAFV